MGNPDGWPLDDDYIPGDDPDEPAEPWCFTCYDRGGPCCHPGPLRRLWRRAVRAWRAVRYPARPYDTESPF